MNACNKYKSTTSFLINKNFVSEDYKYHDILSLENFKKVQKEIIDWQNYKATPLHSLDSLALKVGVNKIYYKDEHHRFGLKSFKALGGAYAVARLLIEELKKKGIDANSKDLIDRTYYPITKEITVSCATDGNHGKSVAWGANMFGCKCEIFIHSLVSENRKNEIEKFGANVTRIDGNYDDSVKIASETAKEKKYFVISDTSYEGYTEIPKNVMQGYTVMVNEALEQMKEKPTHIFLQGGVGGMAAAVVSFCQEIYGKDSPKFIIVEPKNADCLFQSAKQGKPAVVEGQLETIMAGLSCGEVSLLAWDILKNSIFAFVTVEDDCIAPTMQLLANNETPIIAGESGVAGLAGFLIIANDEENRKQLGIDKNSKILFFGTEGDTDTQMYKKLISQS